VRTSFGGVSRNVAENLARLGQPVSLITVVGNDDFGKKLLEQATSLGIDVHACIQTSEFNTASYLAILTDNGRLQYGLDDMRILALLSPDYLKKIKSVIMRSSSMKR
jgi:pseudouridine kinase